MIEIKNVSFGYGKGSTVLEQLSLNLKPGSIYGLLGENGVGKTTLLKMMAGLLFPRTGEIRVAGFEPRHREAAFLQQVYFLPDSPQVEEISLDNYAKLNACFYPNFSETDFRHYISALEVDSRRAMHKLSFGQQKKAMLAFALACNTPVLLMDEPTNGLDIPSKSQLRRLIAAAVTEEKCFVISTHQVRDLEQLIDPVVIMERQRVLLNGSMAEIGERLWFGVVAEKPENCLYAEPAMGGYFVVTPRTEGQSDSKVQLEALFNAAITNRAYFQETFRRAAAPARVVENTAASDRPDAGERQAAPAAKISPLKRFGCFLRAEIFTKYKTYLLMLGIILGLYMWRWVSYLMSSADFPTGETVYGAWSVAVLLMIFAPYLLYRELYHPVKGFSFMMRPVSNGTRFGVVLLQSVVVVPLLLLVWCGLLDCIMNLLVRHSLAGPNIWVDGLYNTLTDVDVRGLTGVFGSLLVCVLLVLGPQASVLWGTCFFKRHKLLKLMAVYFGLLCVASWAIFRIAAMAIGFDLSAWLTAETVETWLKVGVYVLTFGVWLGLYLWSYVSFKRRQV